MARIKAEQLIMVPEIRDMNTGKIHTNLIGETISRENNRWLIYFKSIDMCAYIEREFLIPATKAARILYGA